MAIFDSLANERKYSWTPQGRRGMGLLVTGLFLTVIALSWRPAVTFRGKDWTELFHHVVLAVAMILEVTGIILLVKAIAWRRGGES